MDSKKKKEISRKQRAELRDLILTTFRRPYAGDGLVVKEYSTTEIKEILKTNHSLRFVGQQMQFLGYLKNVYMKWQVVPLKTIKVHPKVDNGERTGYYFDLLKNYNIHK